MVLFVMLMVLFVKQELIHILYKEVYKSSSSKIWFRAMFVVGGFGIVVEIQALIGSNDGI